jgi:RNA-binding protein YlmH
MLVRQVIQNATGMSRRKCFSLFRGGKVILNDVVCESFGSTCQVGDVVVRDDGSQHSVMVDD